MAVLVTRPHPDDEATAAGLRAKGYEVLRAPMLRFEAVAFQDDQFLEDSDAGYAAVIITSTNALRGLEPHLQAPDSKASRLLDLPLFTVGEHTASAARAAGFTEVIAADGDAAGLRDCVLASVKAKVLKKASTLLYLAGADLARDLAGELGERGFTVVTQTTYRMNPVSSLPREVGDAFAANGVEAVLHYSRRSARAFLEAARTAGVEISALAIPQCCISAAVASVVRDAGATQVVVAATPDENALFGALDRALRS
jgi:uroporphyrinogen-III synthase